MAKILIFIMVLAIIGFAVAVSVAGAIVLAIFATLFAIFIAGVSAFWPVILFVLVVYYLVKDKPDVPRHNRY